MISRLRYPKVRIKVRSPSKFGKKLDLKDRYGNHIQWVLEEEEKSLNLMIKQHCDTGESRRNRCWMPDGKGRRLSRWEAASPLNCSFDMFGSE